MGDNVMAKSDALSTEHTTSEHNSPDTSKGHKSKHGTTDSNEPSPSPEPEDDDSKTDAPVQKRRRVTRACDECRRKKIKCDGKQPCTHCTVYSYECTYDQPSNRRRNPAPQYIEALEQRLHKTEAILRAVLPGIDIDDPKFDAHGVDQIVESTRARQTKPTAPTSKTEDDTQLQSMVEQTGSLDLDDSGNWDFHGHTSGYMLINRFRAKYGASLLPIPQSPDHKNYSHTIDSPKSIHSSMFGSNGTLNTDLPTREIAIEYCRVAIDDGCALTRPVHRPTFFKRLNDIYDTDPEQWDNQHMRFLPLLYSVMALGCLFAQGPTDELDQKGYQNGIDQGYQWFNASKSMLDITDCRDLLSLQTVVFMIFFLQGSAKLATCYSYIGIALRGCCRLGMHRKVTGHFNTIEQEERKRCFWLVRKLDTYAGTMLGLPQMLSEDDIDQELPTEVNDDYILEDGIVTMPTGTFSLMTATNSHTKLLFIMKKVLVYVYPLKSPGSANVGDHYTVGHSRIRELERDLQNWMDQLPMELRPSGDSDMEMSRVQQLLRMSYAYVQMMMYRPFLHYVSPVCQTGTTDKRSFACAAACVSVARNIVHITSEMRRRGLLGGAYWFVMYITYFAILSLVYFVLENPDSPASKDILKDAREGRETLASLARRSFAADRCTSSLKSLFDELPDKLKERRSSLQTASNVSRKRSQPSADPVAVQQGKAPANLRSSTTGLSGGFTAPNQGRAMPSEYLSRVVKRSSIPNSPATGQAPFMMTPDSRPSTLVGSQYNSPHTNTPPTLQLDWSVPQMQQGNLPDLKNVMFPSDNPFAYGNQPISTLENSSFGGLQDVSFSNDRFGNTGDTNYSTPTSMNQAPHQPDFEMNGLGMGESNQFPPQDGSTPNFMGGGGNGQPSIFGMPGNMVDEPTSMPRQQPPQPQETYWNQQDKGQFTGRSGFTPGGHGVNLDELFGGGNGWGPMNMGMDTIGMNMSGGGNGGHAGQQHGMSGMWPNNNDSGWQ